MADISESTKMPHHTSISVQAAMEAMRAGNTQRWSGAIYDHLRNHAFLLETLASRAAPPAMDREAVEKVREAASAMLPKNVCLTNPNWADGTVVPLETTLGELRALSAALSTDAIRQGEETFRPFSEWNEDDRDVLWWMLPVQSTPYLGSPLDLGFTVGTQLYNQFGDVIGKTEANVGGWPFSADDEANLVWSRLPATPASHASDGGK